MPILGTSKHLRKNRRTRQFLILGGTIFCQFWPPETKAPAGVRRATNILNGMGVERTLILKVLLCGLQPLSFKWFPLNQELTGPKIFFLNVLRSPKQPVYAVKLVKSKLFRGQYFSVAYYTIASQITYKLFMSIQALLDVKSVDIYRVFLNL